MKRKRRVQTRCAHCGRKTTIKPSRIEKSKSGLVFCSNTCAGQYWVSLLPHNARCLYCGKTFHRSPSGLRQGHNTYCSRECYNKARRAGIANTRGPGEKRGKYVKCAYCGKTVYRSPSALQENENHFCSRECMARYRTREGKAAHMRRLVRERGRCEICRLDNTAILIVHHKDGDRENNDESNLTVLCPNCHARVHRGKIDLSDLGQT